MNYTQYEDYFRDVIRKEVKVDKNGFILNDKLVIETIQSLKENGFLSKNGLLNLHNDDNKKITIDANILSSSILSSSFNIETPCFLPIMIFDKPGLFFNNLLVEGIDLITLTKWLNTRYNTSFTPTSDFFEQTTNGVRLANFFTEKAQKEKVIIDIFNMITRNYENSGNLALGLDNNGKVDSVKPKLFSSISHNYQNRLSFENKESEQKEDNDMQNLIERFLSSQNSLFSQPEKIKILSEFSKSRLQENIDLFEVYCGYEFDKPFVEYLSNRFKKFNRFAYEQIIQDDINKIQKVRKNLEMKR